MATNVITLYGPTPLSVAEHAGLPEYISIAEAAGRAGLTPWEVGELVIAGQLLAVTVKGKPYVSAVEVDALD